MKIRTVLGDIPPQNLGKTSCHEHLLWTVPEPYAEEDLDLGFDSIPAAVAEMRYYKSAGGNALVEMTTKEIGRAPCDLQQISLASGVHIIATSGHHKDKFSASALQGQSVDEMVKEMIQDITTGMDGTDIRAGVLKAGTSKEKATDVEKKVIQAVGIVHQETGAPVSTHTEAGSFALKQADLLMQSGVAPNRMLIGHLDRNLPRETYYALAEKGVYLGFDQIGKEKYWPDEERVRLIKDMLDHGFGEQILLSGDIARKSGWHTHNPYSEGPAYLYLQFIPVLQEAGVTDEQIETLVVHNPARFLAF